jgi:hypothetical protein
MTLPNDAASCLVVYQQVLELAISISGDPGRAARWCEQEPIACFGGKTAKELAAENRGADVLRYLQSLEAGPAGCCECRRKRAMRDHGRLLLQSKSARQFNRSN